MPQNKFIFNAEIGFKWPYFFKIFVFDYKT